MFKEGLLFVAGTSFHPAFAMTPVSMMVRRNGICYYWIVILEKTLCLLASPLVHILNPL